MSKFDIGSEFKDPEILKKLKHVWEASCQHVSADEIEEWAEVLSKQFINCDENEFTQKYSGKQLLTIVDLVASLFKAEHYEAVDNLLHNVAPNKSSIHSTICILRTTYPARDKLPNWRRKVEQTKIFYDQIGLDSEFILKGLLNDDGQ